MGGELEVVQAEADLAAEARGELDAAPLPGAVGYLEPSLSAKEERIVLAMLEHGTIARAAEALRVHRRTVERTLAHQHVGAALRARGAELTEAAGLKLRQAAGEAVEAILGLMRGEVPEGTFDRPTPRERLLAASKVLELGFKATEHAGPVARSERAAAARALAPKQECVKKCGGGGADY